MSSVKTRQEVEDRHYEVAADALGDDGPAEGQHAVIATVHGAQVAQFGGAVVPAHVHLRAVLVVGQADDGAHVGEVVFGCVALVGVHGKVGVFEGDAAFRVQYGGEVLLFEGHPVEVYLDLFLFVLAEAQVVGVLVRRGLVVYAAVVALAVAVAVAAATAAAVHLFLSQHAVLPLEVHVRSVAHQFLEAHEVDVEVHLVAVAMDGVGELEVALVGAVAHFGAEAQVQRVVAGYFHRVAVPWLAVDVGGEDEVFGVDHTVVLGREDEVHVVVRGGDEHQLVAVVGLVAGEHHAVDAGALGVELHGHALVADFYDGSVALGGGVEYAHVGHLALGAGQHGVAGGGHAVECGLGGHDAVLDALGFKVGGHGRVVHPLPLGQLLLRGGDPEHVANEDGKYQYKSYD